MPAPILTIWSEFVIDKDYRNLFYINRLIGTIEYDNKEQEYYFEPLQDYVFNPRLLYEIADYLNTLNKPYKLKNKE
jgi:hypothetical protein